MKTKKVGGQHAEPVGRERGHNLQLLYRRGMRFAGQLQRGPGEFCGTVCSQAQFMTDFHRQSLFDLGAIRTKLRKLAEVILGRPEVDPGPKGRPVVS